MRRARPTAFALEIVLDAGRSRLDRPQPAQGPRGVRLQRLRDSPAESYHPALRYIAPVHIGGPTECNLLAVWAQNASAGGIRKNQLGPLRRALSRYKGFLGERPAVVAGDLNSNTIWDKSGWRINHSTKVRILEQSFGLVSAYHAVRGEAHGAESEPTLYWRDRTKDGPTYHIDYIFVPSLWIGKVRELSIGTFETWCGSGLSDHVPVVVDVDV